MEKITMGGREITVRQLTMRQIREVLAQIGFGFHGDGGPEKPVRQGDGVGPEKPVRLPHVVDLVFDDDLPAAAVAAASGLTLDELGGDFTQDEISALLEKVRERNPFFVAMAQRVVGAVTRSGRLSPGSVS